MSRKVLYLTPFPPTRSGIADYAVCYKQALEEYTDWHLEVVTQQEHIIGNSIGDMFSIYRQVKQWQTDGVFDDVALVHAEIGYTQHREFYTLFWIQRLLPDLPYCITVHDPPLVIAPALYYLSFGLNAKLIRHGFRLLDYTFLGRATIRSVLSGAACSFVLSNVGAKALNQMVGKKARIRSLPHINYRSEISLQRKNIKNYSEPLNILFMGFWHKSKGIEVLLKAIENVIINTKQKVKLLMTGGLLQNNQNQKYVQSILNIIENSPVNSAIEVLGYVQPNSVDATFDQSDIFVLPYTQSPGYSSSGVLMRAMVAGLAIVATDFAPINEDIRHLETGLLVTPNDVNAMEKALISLINEPELRLKLGTKAQECACQAHSPDRVADIASNIYTSISF
ncbi:MAG: glycosyltransferase family 4 protein [Aulosira sp. DedQUE10]|nr:glycosyltransferase family 4 protein [Aulosira sp. DedQUE10]